MKISIAEGMTIAKRDIMAECENIQKNVKLSPAVIAVCLESVANSLREQETYNEVNNRINAEKEKENNTEESSEEVSTNDNVSENSQE